MNFGERLQVALKGRNYTQAQLATELNVLPAAIQQYRNGSRYPKQSTVIVFSKQLDLSSFLLEEDNFGYVKLETKGDLIALLIEGIKRGLLTVVDSPKNKNELCLEFSPTVAQFFKKSIAPVISDVQIAEAVKHWNDEWTIDYLAHKDVNTEEIQQYQLDDLAKKQISFAIMYNDPIK